eukprot:13040357-Alexandrium_andersonii.AAC.1
MAPSPWPRSTGTAPCSSARWRLPRARLSGLSAARTRTRRRTRARGARTQGVASATRGSARTVARA